MQCIKCEEGVLKEIKFKRSGEIAYVCDYCETFWMRGEIIKYNTGHSINPYAPGDDYEYAVQERDKMDQDHQAVANVRKI